jgi:hypothetical protein
MQVRVLSRCVMPQLTPIAQPSAPEVHEEEYVHSVYENIALHFSNTRYKVEFLDIVCQLSTTHRGPTVAVASRL